MAAPGLAKYSGSSRCFRVLRVLRSVRPADSEFSLPNNALRGFGLNLDMAEVGSSNLPGPTIISTAYAPPRNLLAKFWQNIGKINAAYSSSRAPNTPAHANDADPLFMHPVPALAGRITERFVTVRSSWPPRRFRLRSPERLPIVMDKLLSYIGIFPC